MRYNAQMESYQDAPTPLEVRCYLDYFDFTPFEEVQAHFHVLHEASTTGDTVSQILHDHFLSAFALYPEDAQMSPGTARGLYELFAYSDHYNDRLTAMNSLPYLWRYDNSSAVLEMLHHNLVMPISTPHDAIVHDAAEVAARRVAAVRLWQTARSHQIASLAMRRAMHQPQAC